MNTDRIKEIQQQTAYPESVSVQQALLKVWNECEQEQLRIGDVMLSLQQDDSDMLFHECPNCNWRCNCNNQPCSCCNEE
jgi:hypothetical protein